MPDFGDHRVMACTARDIERWLAEITGRDDLRFQDNSLAVPLENGDSKWTLTISIQMRPPRRIALLHIQQLEVRFSYPPGRAGAARAWIGGFDRHTQRGGG